MGKSENSNYEHPLGYYTTLPDFTRLAVSLWAMTVLTLYIRVQVNILGRHLYIDEFRGMGASYLVRPFHFAEVFSIPSDEHGEKDITFKSVLLNNCQEAFEGAENEKSASTLGNIRHVI
ncbi:hypothetical protein IFM89_019877 [Coptis chinensis]|uniref:Uncharacterized protein n=1 Tax=Coptis chinensis TaxID=261450 RepID=A0A835H5K9_9MAGN|nr:hypothetical protein IFM89_019877 [Coptis chinensis]